MAVGFSPASGGAVVDGTVFPAGCEGKRSTCVTCQQAVTTPVSLSTRRLPPDPHITATPADLDAIPENGQEAERQKRNRRTVFGSGGGEG